MAPLKLPKGSRNSGNSAEIVDKQTPSVQAEIVLAPADMIQQKRQEEREKRLNRFNQLTLYLPVLLVALFFGILLGLITWAALFQGSDVEMGQASGVADAFITLTCLLPLAIVGIIFPVAGIGALVWRYQKGSVIRKPLTNLAHKGEAALGKAESKLNEQEPRIIDGTIKTRQRIDGILEKINRSVTNATAWIENKTRSDSAE